ncbi:MAG: 50S ribosomal protein L21, partial [Dehalococcoidales bacterium]
MVFGRLKIYALIETNGKQYKVTEGQTLEIDRLEAEEGGTVKLDKVLLLADGDKITFGKPYVEGARVMATVKQNGKGKKIIVFKYKSKVRYRRKNGHRQLFTSLNIDKILPAGVEYVKPVKKAAPKKTVEAVKLVEPTPPKKVAKAVKPIAEAPKKTTAVVKPAAKVTPKKTTAAAK